MNFWKRIKQALGLAERATQIVVPIVDEVAELAQRIRGVDLVGPTFSPNSVCVEAGHYGLVRAGEIVTRPDGAIETCRMEVLRRFPPGLRKGDRWRRFEDAGPFQP